MENGRSVRIFLSSTFRDFGEERDLLVKRVFPALRARLRDRFVELVDVDLRWGITPEQAERGEVLPICLSEIDRARPYFIGLLGERYGWIPPEDGYAIDLLERQPWLDEHRGGKSVTELEILHGVLNNPQMHGRAFFYFRDKTYSETKGGDYLPASVEDQNRQDELKTRIKKSGYPVSRYKDPEALAKRLEQDIWQLLDQDFPAADVPDAFERDMMRHDAYASPRRRLYLGGEKYLDQLKTWLDGDAPKIRIEGQSGGGKSALLANFINAYRKDHPKDLVFEHYLGASADAANPYALIHRLIEFIQRTTNNSLDIPEDPNALIESLPSWLATASAWAKKKKRRWIFAIDSINSLTDLTDLRWWPEFVPTHIHFIISCLPGTVMDALKSNRETASWQVLTVKPLNKRQARDLLITYLAHYNKALPKPMMDQILTHPLVRNPLFIRTLGEELRVFGVHEELQQQITHYLESKTIDDLFERVLQRVEGDCGRRAVWRSITAIWASRGGLTEKEILAIADLAPAIWATIRNALDETLLDNNGRLTFAHDFMAIAVKDRYLPQDQQERQAHRFLGKWFQQHANTERRSYEEPWQWQQAENWSKLKTFLSNASNFVGLINHRSKQEALMYWQGIETHTKTRLDAAGARFAQKWHHDHPDKTGALALLAWGEFLLYASRYKAAIKALNLLESQKQYLSKDQWEQANLARSDNLIALSDFDEGTLILHDLLKTRSKRSGEKHPATAKLMNRLVAVNYTRGNFETAKDIALKTIAIQEDIHGKSHFETSQTLNNLANIDIELSLFQEAVDRHQRVAKIRRKLQGERNVEYAQSLNNLARAQEGMAAYDEALEGYQQSIEIYQEVLGSYNADILKPISNRGLLLSMLGRMEEGRDYQKRALAVAERIFPDDHPEIARLLINLAFAETDFDDRKAYIIRANRICTAKLGAHPYTSASLNFLASIYDEEDDLDAAFDCLEQSIDIAQQSGGTVSKAHADALRSMGEFLYRNDDNDRALPYLEEAIKIYSKILQPDDPWRADALSLVGHIMTEGEDYEKALNYYQKTYDIYQKAFSEDQARLIYPLQNLGDTHLHLGHSQKAIELFTRSSTLAMDMLDDKGECFELDIAYAKRLRETGLLNDAIPFATRTFEFLKSHPEIDQDTNFDAVTCFVLMADDFNDNDQPDLAKTFLGHADHLVQQVMISQPIGRTWPIAFGRLALLYHDLGENDEAITAATTALGSFQDGLDAGEDDITAMDLACVSALLAEIYTVQNKTEQMEYHDNAITALTLKADMIEGYFHELLVPYVIKSLKRNLDQMTDQDRSVTGRLINDIEKKLSED